MWVSEKAKAMQLAAKRKRAPYAVRASPTSLADWGRPESGSAYWSRAARIAARHDVSPPRWSAAAGQSPEALATAVRGTPGRSPRAGRAKYCDLAPREALPSTIGRPELLDALVSFQAAGRG